MTILGIDPGYATVGFGIIQGDRSKQKLIQYGAIRTPAGEAFAARLRQVFDDTCLLVRQFCPDAIAIEELFFNKNEKTAIQVAHARGVLLLAGESLGVPLYEYTPLQVKQAVTGYGRADKGQMMEMVRRHLGLNQIPKPDDAADALAVALCHLRSATNLLSKRQGGNQACSTT
ncbi:MAG: crossover junction endodeoxyribonuclease RuvC [Oscillospiraceae bacterium]|nr:crossover junction endodeoxyribonuclease RuvC [Oscillospiraceae bacterium]